MTTQTMNFDGLSSAALVGNYYGGGAGPNYGITFDGSAKVLGRVGSAPFSNNPSGLNVCALTNATDSMVINSSNPLVSQVSFYYSAAVTSYISIFSGPNGTGTLLKQVTLPAQYTLGCATSFCHWDLKTVTFTGSGLSIVFDSASDLFAFDDLSVTFAGGAPSIFLVLFNEFGG